MFFMQSSMILRTVFSPFHPPMHDTVFPCTST